MGIYSSDGTRNSTIPTNNFLDVGYNLKRVVNKILKNDDLVKLLYYNTPNVDSQPALTNAQKAAMINDHIKLVPKVPKDLDLRSYIIINLDQFSSLGSEYNYRTFMLNFDVLCHAEYWIMDDYMLRPFKILHELDKMFNNSKLDSLGPTVFERATQIVLNEEFMGYSIFYRIMDFQ